MTGQTVARRFEVRNLAEGEAEVYLYNTIGAAWEGVTAKQFVDEVTAKAAGAKTLTLNINSPGGSVYEADAIVNFLDRHPAAKVCNIDGLAASAAATIAMACPVRNIAANAMMMVHRVRDFAFGTAEEMRKTADVVDRLDNTVCDAYARATGQTPEKCAALMADETWMDAGEAKALGFATAIVGEKKAVALAGITAASLSQFHFKHNEKLSPFVVSGEPSNGIPTGTNHEEPDMANETKPGKEAGGAAEPINLAEHVKTEGKRYMDAFGPENGAKYFAQGMTFEAAQSQHAQDLAASNQAKDAEIADLKNKLTAANAAVGTEPLSGAHDETDGTKGPSNDERRLASFVKVAKGDKAKAQNLFNQWKARQEKQGAKN